jgi:hypothetical protein
MAQPNWSAQTAQRRVVKVRYFTYTTRLWAEMFLAVARPESPPPGRHSEDIHFHNPAVGRHLAATRLSARSAHRRVVEVKKFWAAEFFFPPSPIHSTHPAFTTPRPPQRVPGGTLIVRYDGPCMFVPSQVLRVMGGPLPIRRVTLERHRRWWSPFGRPLRAGSALHERGKTADGGVEKLRLWIKSSPRIRLTLSKSY